VDVTPIGCRIAVPADPARDPRRDRSDSEGSGRVARLRWPSSNAFTDSAHRDPSNFALAELHNLLHSTRDCRCAATVVVQKARFFSRFDDAAGSKDRRRSESKNWIDQVLLSVIFSVYGEVAERLKAAVC
jgi:hypothetical protein